MSHVVFAYSHPCRLHLHVSIHDCPSVVTLVSSITVSLVWPQQQQQQCADQIFISDLYARRTWVRQARLTYVDVGEWGMGERRMAVFMRCVIGSFEALIRSQISAECRRMRRNCHSNRALMHQVLSSRPTVLCMRVNPQLYWSHARFYAS